MNIRNGAALGCLLAIWMLALTLGLLAFAQQWCELSDLIGLDWRVAVERRFPVFGYYLADKLWLCALMLIVVCAALGMLVSALLRTINRNTDQVGSALIWSMRAMTTAVPAFAALFLVVFTVSTFAPGSYYCAFAVGPLATIYLFFGCLDWRMVSSETAAKWWQAYWPAFSIVGLVLAIYTMRLGLDLLSLTATSFDRPLWPLGALLAELLGASLGVLAVVVVVFSLSPAQLLQTVRRSRKLPVLRAIIDLEIRLTILFLVILAPPVILSAVFLVFAAPQIEQSYRAIQTPLPVALSAFINLGRGIVSGYWVLLALPFNVLHTLSSGRLMVMLFRSGDLRPASRVADLGVSAPL